MSGIYILETTDGYRVAYSKKYDDLVGMNTNIDYYVNGRVAEDIFKNCFSYKTKDEAFDHAKRISSIYGYTDDGVCLISYAKNLTFGELIENGKNTRR